MSYMYVIEEEYKIVFSSRVSIVRKTFACATTENNNNSRLRPYIGGEKNLK